MNARGEILRGRSRVLIELMVVVFLASLITLGSAKIAQAYRLRGCYYEVGTISPISYYYNSVSSSYQTAFYGAQSAWDATAAPGYFVYTSNPSSAQIDVFDSSYSASWWALNSMTGCTGSLRYVGNWTQIQFNTRTMSSLTAYRKKLVAEHEIGHSYGLGHVYSGCYVMRQGTEKFTCGSMPTYDDVLGVQNAPY